MKKKKNLNEYEKISQKRLLELIDEFTEGSRVLFAEKTGISRGSISQYCNGNNTPSSISAEKIATALGINPVWLMGFDVPKYSNDGKIKFNGIAVKSSDSEFIRKIKELSIRHRYMLISYLNYLLSEENKEPFSEFHYELEEYENEKNN